jgi:multidrug resistance protein, MATE family
VRSASPTVDARHQIHGRAVLSEAFAVSAANGLMLATNLVDLAMVARLPASSAAVAAVGLSQLVLWSVTAIAVGLGYAVQVDASRRRGAGDTDQSFEAASEGLRATWTWGVALSVASLPLVSTLFAFLSDDRSIQALGIPYLEIRLALWFLTAHNYVYRGFLWGMGRAWLYLGSVLAILLLNTGLGWLLVFGAGPVPSLGVPGSAVASVAAVAGGSLLLTRMATARGAKPRPPSGRRELRRQLALLGAPIAASLLISFLSYTAFSALAGMAGSAEIAASVILINLLRLFTVLASGVGVQAATLVSMALGAGAPRLAVHWGTRVAAGGAFCFGSVGLLMSCAPEHVLGMFSNDPEVIEAGSGILTVLGLGIGVEIGGQMLSYALEGAGTPRPVLVWNLIALLLFLPGAGIFGVWLGYGLWGLWLPLLLSRALATAAIAGVFLRWTWTMGSPLASALPPGAARWKSRRGRPPERQERHS